MSAYLALYERLKGLGVPHALVATVHLVHAGVATVDGLVDWIGKSRKQIQRDLAVLEDAGILSVRGGQIRLSGAAISVLNGNGIVSTSQTDEEPPQEKESVEPPRSTGKGEGNTISNDNASSHRTHTSASVETNLSWPSASTGAYDCPGTKRHLMMSDFTKLPGVDRRDFVTQLHDIYERSNLSFDRFCLYAHAACDCTKAMMWRGRIKSDPASYALAMVRQMIRERWEPGSDLRYWGANSRTPLVRDPSNVA